MAHIIETEDAANRLAHWIASDLAFYNEDVIVQGIKDDNLFEVLAEKIEEGRKLYDGRVDPSLQKKNFFDRAVIDTLIRYKGDVPSSMW